MKNEVNHTLGVKKNSLYYLLIVSIILSLTCAPVVSYAMPEPVPATQTDKQKAAAAKKKEAEKKKKEAEKAKAAKEKQKAFYSGITDALREYMDARFGIDAPEMTTSEIFGSLSHSDVPTDLFVETRRLFETADMVKFAKAYATDEENAAAVPLAVRFVTSTYQTDSTPAGDSQETQDGQPKPSMTENQGGTE